MALAEPRLRDPFEGRGAHAVEPIRTAMAGRLGSVALIAAVLASTAVAARGDAERRAINAHDQAWAKRINLTLRDLPSGFTQGPRRPSASNPTGLTCPGFSPDLSRFTITGEAVSRQFVRMDTSIFSSAEIFRSVSDQRGDWALTARREALACLRHALQSGIPGGSAVKAVMRTAPRLGERAIVFRATVSVTASGIRSTIWLDLLGVARGRGDATLGVIAVGKPPSAALEQSLLAKLASRLAS